MNRRTVRSGAGLAGRVALCLVFCESVNGADHRDGPIITDINNSPAAALDLNDLYIFRAPGNPSNTVVIFTVSPFAGDLTPSTFDPSAKYELHIDQDHDYTPDLTFRAAFSPVRDSSAQTVRLSVSRPGRPARVVASGDTNNNIPIEGGGMFRAGVQDDPFFFDTAGFNLFIAAGQASFPRPSGTAVNFFGPNVNTLAIVIELPTVSLLKTPEWPILYLWSETAKSTGKQVDRNAQPLLNICLIPPVPRNDTSQDDRRDAFNAGTPTSDLRKFRADMISVLTGFWKNTPNRAGALVDRLLLPAVMTYDTSLTFEIEGFPNGRRLRDDVVDYMLKWISDGKIVTDNVDDDNGDRITDGSLRPNGEPRSIAFPYIGAPNLAR